jgi:hypothetical protein
LRTPADPARRIVAAPTVLDLFVCFRTLYWVKSRLWHGIVLDGVYTGFGLGESLAFHEATQLQDEEIEGLVRHTAALIYGDVRRRRTPSPWRFPR